MEEEDWVIYFITLFTFAVIFLFCYIRHVYTFFERNRISSSTYPTFPFGNAYDVCFGRIPTFMQLWKFYNRFKRKKCKFGGFYVFLKPAILIVDPELTKTVVSRSEFFQDLHDTHPSNFNGELGEKLLVKITRNIQSVWPKLPLNENSEVNLNETICNDFIGTCLQELFGLETGKNLFGQEKSGRFSAFRELFSISYPHLYYKSCNRTSDIDDLIQCRRKNNVHLDDIVQMLLKNNFSEKEIGASICEIVSNLKIAHNLLLFTLFELIHNEEIQDDLRGEIMRFRKSSSAIVYKDLNELRYLETIICETLRKYPVIPFMYKVCREHYLDNDVSLPKGIVVFISTFGIHHDSQNYTNPELFDPDRFSEENEKYIDPSQYLPFGSGGTNEFSCLCVKLLMKITLIELLSRYKFLPGKKTPKSIEFDAKRFNALKFKEDLWLKVSGI